MAEPAIRDFSRLPRIDRAWRMPTAAELPDERESRLQLNDR